MLRYEKTWPKEQTAKGYYVTKRQGRLNSPSATNPSCTPLAVIPSLSFRNSSVMSLAGSPAAI